jgi:hypothetical protein
MTKPTTGSVALRPIVLLILSSLLVLGSSSLSQAQLRSIRAGHHTVCNLVAAPYGSDRQGRGTRRRPFLSLARLDRELHPGQRGCLRAGVYGSTSTWHLLDRSGRRGARITLTSYPGEVATVVGYVDLEGSYTTLSHVIIDGSNNLFKAHHALSGCPATSSQPLIIAGHNDTLEYDNYYQSIPGLRGNGIGIGFWGNADNTIIRYDKIHDVGQCQAYDHLIYLSHGNDVQIYGNWLWNDPHGRGVQLYPAPANARVFGNVIDRAGEGFGIGNEAGLNVSGNHIFDNIITNSTGLPWEGIPGVAISDSYGGTPGTGNVFSHNVCYHCPGGIGRVRAVRLYHNTTANPRFVNEADHDYQLMPGSRVVTQKAWTVISALGSPGLP